MFAPSVAIWPEKGHEESTAQGERIFCIHALVTTNGDKRESSFNHTERNKQTGPRSASSHQTSGSSSGAEEEQEKVELSWHRVTV